MSYLLRVFFFDLTIVCRTNSSPVWRASSKTAHRPGFVRPSARLSFDSTQPTWLISNRSQASREALISIINRFRLSLTNLLKLYKAIESPPAWIIWRADQALLTYYDRACLQSRYVCGNVRFLQVRTGRRTWICSYRNEASWYYSVYQLKECSILAGLFHLDCWQSWSLSSTPCGKLHVKLMLE